MAKAKRGASKGAAPKKKKESWAAESKRIIAAATKWKYSPGRYDYRVYPARWIPGQADNAYMPSHEFPGCCGMVIFRGFPHSGESDAANQLKLVARGISQMGRGVTGVISAATTRSQVAANKALKALGFKPVMKGKNPIHNGREVTLWAVSGEHIKELFGYKKPAPKKQAKRRATRAGLGN